jgi:cation transport ATPase
LCEEEKMKMEKKKKRRRKKKKRKEQKKKEKKKKEKKKKDKKKEERTLLVGGWHLPQTMMMIICRTHFPRHQIKRLQTCEFEVTRQSRIWRLRHAVRCLFFCPFARLYYEH